MPPRLMMSTLLPTIALRQSQTRSIAIAAPPEIVLDVVADPINLPR